MILEQIVFDSFGPYYGRHIIDLDQVTCFIGENDSGKSMIVNSLLWVMRNRPLGDLFLNVKTKRAYVKLIFDNGTEVIRVKDKNEGINSYFLNGKEFTRFRDDVPIEITRALSSWLLSIDSREIDLNFALQDDPHFIISLTDSEKALIMSNLFGGNEVDQVIESIAIDIRKLKSDYQRFEDEKKRISYELESLKNVDSQLKKLEDLKKLSIKIEDLDTRKIELDSLYRKYNDNYQKILKLANQFKRSKAVNQIDIDLVSLKINECLQFDSLYDSYQVIERKIQVNSDRRNTVSKEFDNIENDMNDILSQVDVCPVCLSPIDNPQIIFENLERIKK